MHDLGAQPTTSSNKLRVGFCWARETGVPGEIPSEQARERTQSQLTYDARCVNPRATLVGCERSHHYAPVRVLSPLRPSLLPL